MFSFVKTT